MGSISESVKKLDHDGKISGSVRYIDDERKDGVLYGKIVRSTCAKGRIKEIRYPQFPEGYGAAGAEDVPKENAVHVVEDDMPVFAESYVRYIGEPIAILAGPDRRLVEDLLRQVEVVYEKEEPVVSLEQSSELFYEKSFCYGDVDQAFAESDEIMEEEFHTGHQEHAYLEPQAVMAVPDDDVMIIRGSMQCPYYICHAVAKTLGVPSKKVRVIQSVTGGGFGGKEDYPSVLACEAAVAARKFGKPVYLAFDRREDMEFTSKRHPSHSRYRAALKDGRVAAMDICVELDAGAYKTLSLVVLQRTMICANGVYGIEHLRVHGCAKMTNTVPNGAFRGFGDPQAFFAAEMFMDHVAAHLGENPWEFKKRHLPKKGDFNSTRGIYHEEVPLLDMMEQLDRMCDYRHKKELYKTQSGRYRRGIGSGLHFHGTGFATTKDSQDDISVKLHKYPDGTVEVLTANTEMGQGLSTAFAKIVGKVLGISYTQIKVPAPDTDIVPDSGPTVASRSVVTVGELVRRAAAKLKKTWQEGMDQTVTEAFIPPEDMIPFDTAVFYGDPYPAHAWGAAAVELEVDTQTGLADVIGVYGVYDIGTVIDDNIAKGQMEGGILQGIGHASMEQMKADSRGRIRNNSYSDYIIPTAADVPAIQVEFYKTNHPDGPFGAKGAGELPNAGVPGAYAEALEQALGYPSIRHIPYSAEETLNVWEGKKDG